MDRQKKAIFWVRLVPSPTFPFMSTHFIHSNTPSKPNIHFHANTFLWKGNNTDWSLLLTLLNKWGEWKEKLNMAKCLLHKRDLPKHFCAETLSTIVYLLNLVPTKVLKIRFLTVAHISGYLGRLIPKTKRDKVYII